MSNDSINAPATTAAEQSAINTALANLAAHYCHAVTVAHAEARSR